MSRGARHSSPYLSQVKSSWRLSNQFILVWIFVYCHCLELKSRCFTQAATLTTHLLAVLKTTKKFQGQFQTTSWTSVTSLSITGTNIWLIGETGTPTHPRWFADVPRRPKCLDAKHFLCNFTVCFCHLFGQARMNTILFSFVSLTLTNFHPFLGLT